MTSRLADLLVRIEAGKSFGAAGRPAGDNEWGIVKVSAMTWGEFRPGENKLVSDISRIDPRHEIRSRDVLVSRANTTEYVGAPVLVRNTRPRLLLSDKSLRLVPRAEVDPAYLHAIMSAPQTRKRISALATGTKHSMRNISQHALLGLEVPPLPSLAQQRRIVDLLEDHLSRLDAADAYLRTGIARARAWHARLIDQLVWSPGYPRRDVRSLLREPMRNGRSDRAVQGSEFGTRTLTLTAVTQNCFSEANTKVTTTTPDRARGLWLEPGDVFVQRSNTPELVGTCARYDGPTEWAIFPDLLIRLRSDESLIDSRFLVAALRSGQGHAQLRRRAKGAAGSMPKIDQDAVGSALIPLPPREDQQRILGLIGDADEGLRRLRAELDAAQRHSGALRRAVLAAAFSARLTGAGGGLSVAEEMICA